MTDTEANVAVSSDGADAAAARKGCDGAAASAPQEGDGDAARSAPAPNCSFFKKPALKGKNIRKRTKEDSDEDEEQQGSAVVQKKKNQRKGTISTGTGKTDAQEDEVKTGFAYESSRDVQTGSDNYATATLETETEFDKDARSLREKRLKNAAEAVKRSNEDDGSARASSGPSVYKGMNNYTDHLAGLRRENTISSEKAGGAHGPLRGSQHIRMSIRIDYQPDVCKDYKETGYCGYGDSCKFLHDRGDYKSGWQLEKDWEEQQKAKKERQRLGLSEDADKDDEDDEELPFACFVCREPFTDPVVTKCKHYFCEKCALKHYTKNKNCFVCNKPTFGIFNTAHDILKRARS